MIRWDRLAAWTLVFGGGLTFWAALIWWSIPTPPAPMDRSVMFCGPRPGLAEPFHACRNENVLVDL